MAIEKASDRACRMPIIKSPCAMVRKTGASSGERISRDQEFEGLTDYLLMIIRNRCSAGSGIKELLCAIERKIILKSLVECGGNQVRTAHFLRLKITTLNEKIKRYKILPELNNSIPPRALFINQLIFREGKSGRRKRGCY